ALSPCPPRRSSDLSAELQALYLADFRRIIEQVAHAERAGEIGLHKSNRCGRGDDGIHRIAAIDEHLLADLCGRRRSSHHHPVFAERQRTSILCRYGEGENERTAEGCGAYCKNARIVSHFSSEIEFHPPGDYQNNLDYNQVVKKYIYKIEV